MNDLQKFEERVSSSGKIAVYETHDVIMEAVRNKLDPSVIEKLMDLAERNEKKEARKAYVAAMNAFKRNPPKIFKTEKAGFDHKSGMGRTEYSFAPLPDICAAIDPELSKHGLSYHWIHEQPEGNIRVTCIMTHELGHSESTPLSAPADTSGKKNPIQAMGSTISYLERYTLLGITGLATHGMDDDTQSIAEHISEDQVTEINDLLKETNSNLKIFLKVAKAKSVEQITTDMYPLLIKQLKTKKEKMRQPGDEG